VADRYEAPDEFVGLKEIAQRLGVKSKTPQQWQRRGVLPKPLTVVGGRPIWRWGVIEAWASRTGRLP
jgi:predicted DNA-binding transcriptional regulator AlpA